MATSGILDYTKENRNAPDSVVGPPRKRIRAATSVSFKDRKRFPFEEFYLFTLSISVDCFFCLIVHVIVFEHKVEIVLPNKQLQPIIILLKRNQF